MAFVKRRWLRALGIGAAVAAALVGLGWYTVQGQTACEVCVEYRGRKACRAASAATRDEAERHAQATACALVTGGVTEDLECQRLQPTRLRCD